MHGVIEIRSGLVVPGGEDAWLSEHDVPRQIVVAHEDYVVGRSSGPNRLDGGPGLTLYLVIVLARGLDLEEAVLEEAIGVHQSFFQSRDGLTIGELSNHKFDSEFTFEVIEKALLKRFPNLKFVSHREFGDTYGVHESEVIQALPSRLDAFECDLVISGTAG